ncbi:MAG: D-aminoacyl-tRNA deacylase [Bacteroides sp.]
MRSVIQRVSSASVTVDGECIASIGQGLLVLVAFTHTDQPADLDFSVRKIPNLRIFNDEAGVMNKSLVDVGGELLLVSQFTLYAQCAKGNRPSYIESAPREVAEPLYEEMIVRLEATLGRPIQRGRFGADMKVALVNDGPVTILL